MDKKGIDAYLIPWLIALLVLLLSVILFFTFSDVGKNLLDNILDIWRFGR